jgi:hypothetical protein
MVTLRSEAVQDAMRPNADADLKRLAQVKLPARAAELSDTTTSRPVFENRAETTSRFAGTQTPPMSTVVRPPAAPSRHTS